MSVIFQLFNAEDLQKLEGKDLETLRSIVIKALDQDDREALKRIVTDALNEEQAQTAPLPDHRPLELNLAPKCEPDKTPPPQINEALNKRFHDVSQQLKSLSLQSSFDFDKLTHRHFNDQANDDEQRKKEETILLWAISCEVNNYEFYAKLRNARIATHDFFYRKTGQRPKGPDSPYSPFHPGHPLYSLLYGL
jgi:hypothetical protein